MFQPYHNHYLYVKTEIPWIWERERESKYNHAFIIIMFHEYEKIFEFYTHEMP